MIFEYLLIYDLNTTGERNTVPAYYKHTHNNHFSHHKHILFALTKMCLLGEKEDYT